MNSDTNQQQPKHSSTGSLVVLAIVSLLFIVVLWQRVLIGDTIRATLYQPSADITAIDAAVGFTSQGTRIFYASSPELNGTSTFNSECENTEKTSVVLGCYQSGRIYVYQVDNTELDGIEEVTAAHEVLHAAYDRLSTSERERIDALLEAEAKKLLQDDAFKERMSVYSKLADADRINELHSVIGTEVTSISAELEAYYGRYFADRDAVLTLYDNYHSVFVDAQAEAIALGKSLDEQALSINARVIAYNQAAKELDAAVSLFNSRARGSYFTTQEEFVTARAELVAESDALEAERVSINQAITRYESDKETFDGLSSHLTELTNSIDSSLAPAPTVSEDQ